MAIGDDSWAAIRNMSDEDKDKLRTAIGLTAIAKLPRLSMTSHEEKAWRDGFEAGALHMLAILSMPAPKPPAS